MTKPYLIIINGVLAGRKLTQAGAIKVVKEYQDRGINAAIAYETDNGTFKPVSEYR